MSLTDLIKIHDNFPINGVKFADLAPILGNHEAFNEVTNNMAASIHHLLDDSYKPKIVAVESRGFVWGAALASKTKLPLILCRKHGKLPGSVHQISSKNEYGHAILEIQRGSIKDGDDVIVVDDVLATGGTFNAVTNLVYRLGVNPIMCCCVLEIGSLNGRKNISVPISSVIKL